MRMTMYRIIFLALLLSFCLCWLQAQEVETEELSLEASIAAISDSLLNQRELEVRKEYGFTDKDELIVVAELLEIKDIPKWKSYLKIEVANKALESMSLNKLGITPYQALLAKHYSIYGFTELSSFVEISDRLNIPIKKLREMAGLKSLDKSKDNTSLQALEIDPATVNEMIEKFRKESLPYSLSLTLVGMLIVFGALLFTSIIISQLSVVNKKTKMEERALVIDRSGKLIKNPIIQDHNAVAAAIIALHIYETGIKEKRKLMLTFKRTPTNQWRASQVLEMPNKEIFRARR